MAADTVETAGELGLAVEPGAVTEMVQPHDTTLTGEGSLLTDERRKAS